MKESFKQKMQENKPPLTFKNTKKNICLKKKRNFFLTLTPIVQHPNYQHYHPNHQILLRCQWYQIQGPRAGRDWNWKMMRPALTFLIVIIFVDSVTSIWQEHSEGFPEWTWLARQNLLYKIPQWLSGSGGIIQKPLMILFVLKTTTTKRLLSPNSFFSHKDLFLPQAYRTFMKDSAQLFGAPSPEAHKFAVDIFNFEKRIAEITPGQDYLADPLKINNKMKVFSFDDLFYMMKILNPKCKKVFLVLLSECWRRSEEWQNFCTFIAFAWWGWGGFWKWWLWDIQHLDVQHPFRYTTPHIF